MLPAATSAWADCTPASADNVIATCTGTTFNQGGGAPGSNGGTDGYGTGAETNATVTVNANAFVTGTNNGIFLSSGTVIVGTGAAVTGIANWGVAASATANVTNSGSIVGNLFGVATGTNATVTNNIGGVISASGVGDGIFAAGSANVINFGTITGGNGIVGEGSSSVFNAGTINGAIEFGSSGNTLTLGPGSIISGVVAGTGGDTFQLGGVGAATFDVSQLNGQYQGFSTFNKVDNSVWTLTGTSTFTGPVNVNGGTLVVNGDITAASSLTVNAGGTLMGTGAVGSTTVNPGGILAPGNSAAGSSMTVNGNLAFVSGAAYMVFLNPTTASFASVAGTATLTGASVVANFAAGSYLQKQYTILTASGGLGGTTFGSVTGVGVPTNLRTALSYDANDVFLNLILSFAIPGGLNANQQNVGKALTNFFNATGGIPITFATLSSNALSQASGESATGTQQTTFNAMTQFMGVMTDPFIAGRNNDASTGGGATGYADEAMAYAKRNPNDALAAIYSKAPPRVTPFEARWSTWVAGFGGSQTTDGNAITGSNSATSRVYGTAVGADYRFSPFTIAGFSLAGGGTSFAVANAGSGHSDLFQAGAFIRHDVGVAYITGALAYGWQDVTTDRTVAAAGIDQLRAEFKANAYSGRVESGYRYVVPAFGGVGITPYAAGQFTTFDLPAYAESVVSGTPAFALGYAAKSVTDSRSELGIRSDKSFAVQNGVLTLRGRVAWAHDFDPDRSIGATFQALPGASFVVNGAAQAPDSALTTASVEMKWINGWSVAGTFEGEFSDVTQSYAGKGVVRYAW
jgi:uncharacterized protein with beta-barrel porin domain